MEYKIWKRERGKWNKWRRMEQREREIAGRDEGGERDCGEGMSSHLNNTLRVRSSTSCSVV
jgi:hypothetical protein